MIASGLVALSAPAQAADDDQLPQGELNVSRIDFASSTAVDQVIKRLHRLAFAICAPNHFLDATTVNAERDFYDTAVRNGMAQIDMRHQLALRSSPRHVAAADPAAAQSH